MLEIRVSTPEKVETIVQSYIGSRLAVGAFGEVFEYEPQRYRVTTDSQTFLIRGDRAGWVVFHRGYAGADRDLMKATRDAMEGSQCLAITK